MTAPRRVVFLGGTLGVGGAERQLFYMLGQLLAREHRPEVVTLEDGVFSQRITDLGVPVTVLEPASNPAVRLGQVIRAARAAEPDLIQAAHNWVSAYVGVTGRLLRIPSIGALRSGPRETLGNVGRLGHLAFRLPHLMASNSNHALEEAVTLGVARHRLVHLPNAVDTARFAPAEPRRGPADGEPLRLLGIGRLSSRKRFDLFLEVVAKIVAERGDVRAILVGDGPERAALESKARELGLSDRLSWQITDDPLPYYRAADLMVFTSGYGEGMPNVLLEGMATGLPVVAFGSGDVSQVVVDGVTGRLISPWGDCDAMALAVQELLTDEATRLEFGRQAIGHVMDNYSLDALGRNVEQLHLQALAR